MFQQRNAECVYFLKNDSNQYIGGNLAKSAIINITFNDSSEIQRIKLEISPEAKFTPIQKIDFQSYRLDNFNWYFSCKPKSKWDVIRDSVQYQMYLFEHPLAVDSNQTITDSLPLENPILPEVLPESELNEINEKLPASESIPTTIEENEKTILPQPLRRLKKGKKAE